MRPLREKTPLFGTGDRYKVRYIDPDGKERSRSFPDRQKKKADDFLIEIESDKRVVSAVLQSAIDDKLIRDNPCKAKTVRRPLARSPKVVVWPDDRIHAVGAGLVNRFSITVPIGCGLGPRQGEILGLSPADIDRDRSVLHVQRQLKTVKGVKMFALPKGGKTRTVPVSAAILAEIDQHLEDHPATAVTLPWAQPDGDKVTAQLLVTGDEGRLYTGDGPKAA